MARAVNRFSEAGFPSAIVNEIQDEDGIDYGMIYAPRMLGTPGGSYLERQSTRQLITLYRVQASRYISRYQTGIQRLLNYPIARGNTIINSAPSNIGAGPTNKSGTMLPSPRFTKALPTPLVPYDAPTY